MSETTTDAKSEASRNLKTLKRLRMVAQEEELKPEPRRHVAELVHRLEYLDTKITAHDCSPKSEAYYRSERRALAWALRELTTLYPHLLATPIQATKDES